jgi:hypothetical protein
MLRAATLLLTFATAAAGGAADAGADARPDDTDLPRADQVWRFDGARLAHLGFSELSSVTKVSEPGLARIGETPVAFLVDERRGDVACIDVATGKTRWRARRPKAAVAKRPGGSPADDVSLFLSGDVLSVYWRRDFESKLAIADGRVLSTEPTKPLIRGLLKLLGEERWKVVQGSLMEMDGRRRVFSLPDYVAQTGFRVLESGERVVLVERDRQIDPHALLVTWTAQAPKPVVLRRPTLATDLVLVGDLLLVGRPAQALMLSRLGPPLSR